jgi:uncharacterized membrane-anchored protein YitT (DUF2179 family)
MADIVDGGPALTEEQGESLLTICFLREVRYALENNKKIDKRALVEYVKLADKCTKKD